MVEVYVVVYQENYIRRKQLQHPLERQTKTSLNGDEDLQLTIKTYPKHQGLTLALSKLEEGDSFLITIPGIRLRTKGLVYLLQVEQELHHL